MSDPTNYKHIPSQWVRITKKVDGRKPDAAPAELRPPPEHEPAEGIGIAEEKVRLGHAAWMKIYNEGGFDHRNGPHYVGPRSYVEGLEKRLTAQAEQIGALICERDQLRREIATVRALLSRLPEDDGSPTAESVIPPGIDVKADIERTIDHLLNGRTAKDQRKGLSTATERAERVKPDADAAVGRAIR